MAETFSSPEANTPSESQSSNIEFWWKRCDALLWKYFVLLSPETSQWEWLLCCHICSSMWRNSFTSDFNCRKTSTLPPCNVATSALLSSFFLSTKVREILHTEFLLHFLSFAWHLSIFPMTATMGEPDCSATQDRATVSWHPSFSSQNCSNLYVAGVSLECPREGLW